MMTDKWFSRQIFHFKFVPNDNEFFKVKMNPILLVLQGNCCKSEGGEGTFTRSFTTDRQQEWDIEYAVVNRV